jgi:hypothetical protein
MSRTYSTEDRAATLAVLRSNNNNAAATARETGIPVRTVRFWRKRQEEAAMDFNGNVPLPPKKAPAGVPAEAVAWSQEHLASRLEEIATQAAEVVAGKLEDASAQQAAVVLGIVIDKFQLLRGRPTAISGRELSDEERLVRVKELARLARSRRQPEPNAAGGAPGAAGGRENEDPANGSGPRP